MNTVIDENKRLVRFYFDGVDDVMKTAGRWNTSENEHVRRFAMNYDDCFNRPDHWNGMHTLDMVSQELLKPTQKMNGVIDSGESLFTSEDWATSKPKRKIRRRLEDGDEIDIDRWREREPDMWEDSHKVKGPRFGVKIGVNIATSAHVNEDGFKWRTSTVVAIMRICEELMIPCEVVGYEQTSSGIYGPNGRYGTKLVFPIKKSENLIDVDLLGYCLGSLSFFRNAVLGSRIVATGEIKGGEWSPGRGLGTPDAWSEKEDNEFVLDRGCLNETNAKREVQRFKDWLVEIRRKAGINFDGLDTIAA